LRQRAINHILLPHYLEATNKIGKNKRQQKQMLPQKDEVAILISVVLFFYLLSFVRPRTNHLNGSHS
jgi:hypothetical protein